MNVVPDVIIGDFDTFSEEELPDNCEIIKHPEDKDDTDTMLAVKLALNRDIRILLSAEQLADVLITLLQIFRP